MSTKPEPDPIPLNEHFTIEVRVEAVDGAALSESVVCEVDADMPAHRHGMNTAPTVSNLGPGRYAVDGLLFHMPGRWELYCDVVQGPVRERATFPMWIE